MEEKSNVILFPRLFIGQIIQLPFSDEKVAVQIVKSYGKNVYRVRALEGKYRGTYADVRISSMNGRPLR